MALGSLGIDSMLPALPAIGASLGVVSENERQLIVTAFLIGMGLGQLIHGPLADRYGRRPVMTGALIAATRVPADGARVFNLGGTRADTATVVGAIEKAVPGAAGLLTYRPEPLPFPDRIDTTGLATIDPPPVTPLADAVTETAARLQSLHEAGRLVPEEHGLVITGDHAEDRP